MNDHSQAPLEADLLGYNGYPYPNYNSQNQQGSLEAAPDDDPNVPNLDLDNIRSNLNYNIKFCILVALIYALKIAASAFVLSTTSSCWDVNSTWIVMMLVHDAIEFLFGLALIRLAIKIRNGPNNVLPPADEQNQPRNQNGVVIQPNPNAVRNYNNENFGLDVEQNGVPRPRSDTTALLLAREVRNRKKCIDALSTINKLYYMIVFIYGQVLFYFYANSTHCGKNTAVWGLMLAFIILGYVWLFWPLLLAILLCLCIPCLPCILFLIVVCFGKPGQVAASKDVINKLPVKKYSSDLPGEHECPICIAEYKEGDNIIELPCSNLHHFHEACIKHWLEINGECPLCRTKITDTKRTQSEELR